MVKLETGKETECGVRGGLNLSAFWLTLWFK